MIDSSNFSLAILIAVGVVGFLIMNPVVDENRKLPPFSTPEGKRARLIGGLVLVAFIAASIFYINSNARLHDEDGVRRMIISSVAGVSAMLFFLVKDWKKDK
jgi:hypothetical protein